MLQIKTIRHGLQYGSSKTRMVLFKKKSTVSILNSYFLKILTARSSQEIKGGNFNIKKTSNIILLPSPTRSKVDGGLSKTRAPRTSGNTSLAAVWELHSTRRGAFSSCCFPNCKDAFFLRLSAHRGAGLLQACRVFRVTLRDGWALAFWPLG